MRDLCLLCFGFCQCGESCFSSEQFSCENGQLRSANATEGGNSTGSEMGYTELNIVSMPIQPVLRRVPVLRPRIG